MKPIKQGLCLALVSAGLFAAPQVISTGADAAPAEPSVAQRMQQDARGSVQTSNENATGRLSFARAGTNGDLLADVKATDRATAIAKATDYLGTYSTAFGAAKGQLKQSSVSADDLGWTVDYAQTYQGIPVFGSLVRAHVDRDGDLTSVNGFASPDIAIDTQARRTPAQAAAIAVGFVGSQPGEAANGATKAAPAISATSTDLVVYRTGAIKGDEGTNVLAYVVEVGNGVTVRDKVFIDADSGKILNRYSMLDDALDRELREATANDNGTPDDETDDTVDFETVYTEGDDEAALNIDQKNLIDSSKESYWFFKNAFGRDSYDGNGAKRITVNNDPRINCPNANWNGSTTNYCDGVTSDDVVAHEWGHAYTEYTWGGIYQWQSGALNEAYSDIWGETTDLINGREDEGEGDLTVTRPVGLCSSRSAANPLLTINAPSTIAKACVTGGLLGAPVITPVTSDVVAPTDAVETGGTATDGCSPYTDASAVVGKIVLVDRGLCTFVEKAQAAKAAGAAAVIIGNRDAAPIGFSDADETLPLTVSIGLADRQAIRASLAAGDKVNVTIKDASGERFDSSRWLIGEKSEAFGGAIRDMWNPTCYGDPGKVSDVEYKCSTDDNGGVHGNSGVPNRGYALLVDGGTDNGTTVRGIGLDKAAAIYFRAMNNYMTPVSDFPDHADSLAASCQDLTGKAIKTLSTNANDSVTSRQRITSDDCAQVEKMAAAVELRKEPVQCDFKPQLDPATPGVCGAGFAPKTEFSADFETGLGAWTLGATTVYPGGLTEDWVTTTTLPSGNKPAGGKTAAFGPADDDGKCVAGAGDFSSVNTMTSPDITITGAAAPRMSFDHAIQTEVGYDGGNVKVSVNGGAFTTVPASAYTFNKPSVLSTAAEESTNPLAGQPGFTGTDGGKIESQWGTSQIDLGALGVKTGDKIKVQFAIGRDGCGGVDGWWVDNVQVVTCVVDTTPPTTPPTPGPTTAPTPAPTSGPAPSPYVQTKVVGSVSPAKVRQGKRFTVAALVTAPGTVPTGTVQVKFGTATLGTISLVNGGGQLKVKGKKSKTLSPGSSLLTLVYSGSPTVQGTYAFTPIKIQKKKR